MKLMICCSEFYAEKNFDNKPCKSTLDAEAEK